MQSTVTGCNSGWPAIFKVRTGGGFAGAVVLLAALLLVPALANGFPLLFPDSGTYLGIATGSDYAIDRSSFYGLLLKPFVTTFAGLSGLWLAIVAQAVAVATVLLAASSALLGKQRPLWHSFAALLPVLLLTALAWHAGQLMPDALTGPLVLLTCLAVSRPAGAPGSLAIWLAVLIMALAHYTHVVLLGAVAAAAIVAQVSLGLGWRNALRRLGMATAVCATACGLLVAANGIALGRWTMSPAGPVFLFARLSEDGLIGRWLDDECSRTDPFLLCTERHLIPRDSQTLLWRDPAGPVARHIWHPATDAERWRWVEMMAAANRGAILARPLAFLASSVHGTARQFFTFQAIDDECPEHCGRDRSGGIGYALARDRPSTLGALDASMQARGTTPKAFVRAISTPVAALGLLGLPVMLVIAWRRRDRIALAFTGGIATALVVNAALAGALSDVHDRYQSRLVWLAPLLILFLALRWRRPACPPRPPGA